MKKISFNRLAYLTFAALVFLSCNKKDAGKGEKEEGVYYNERTDKNGSSDTTANANQGNEDSGQHIGNNTDSTTVDGPKGSVSNN